MTLYFLDLILMIFFIQLVYLSSLNYFGVFKKFFLTLLENVFGLEKKLPLSSFLSSMIFLLLLILCFLSYFSYSFCICGMIEFTFFFALVSWLSTFIVFINSESFSVYMSKSGDNFLKTLSMFLVELVSEFSRPVALTVRLTVNIMVGHLVSMMLFNLLELSSGYFYSWLLIFAIMMECVVFFIQSYIFSRLLFLYLNE